MSGKVKHGPKSPEEEREELRQLTRELHEAAQNARDAARELAGAREFIRATIEETITPEISQAILDLNGHFTAMKDAVDKRIDFYVSHIEQCAVVCADAVDKKAAETEARLAGYSSLEELQVKLEERVGVEVSSLARDEAFISDVASVIMNEAARLSNLKKRQKGQVLVATEEALADYVAAGGNPGIVLRA